MRIMLLLLTCALLNTTAVAQQEVKFLLINDNDSSAVVSATVHLKETGQGAITDDRGAFLLAIPDTLRSLTLAVDAIGFRSTLMYKRTFRDTERVYVAVASGSLGEVTVLGMAPKEIVFRAIVAIPKNYMDEDHYSFSVYRQYQQVNYVYRNLTEALQIVKFSLSTPKGKINAKEAYAVTDLRRVSFIPSPDNMFENSLCKQMLENPIYHLSGSSLDPGRFDDYTFTFDTAVSADYVINYKCNSASTESHGVDNYAAYGFSGESNERGQLVIDKTTYAIKRIKRHAMRNQGYDYPKGRNLVQPEMKYAIEFADGELVADYVLLNGKWYLKRLVHQYTNDFYNAFNSARDYHITDLFEWTAESISKDLEGFTEKFYAEIPQKRYPYDSKVWTDIVTPYHFCKKEVLYKDLERGKPVEEQFEREALHELPKRR